MLGSTFIDFVDGDAPTWMERRIINAAAAGVSGTASSLSSITEGEVDRATRRDARQDHVSATLLQALVTGQFSHPEWPHWTLHGSGLEIEHAIIEGDLEWIGITLERSVSFRKCTFLERVTISGVEVIGSVSFHDCIIPRHLEIGKTKVSGSVIVCDCTWPRSEVDRQKCHETLSIGRQLCELLHTTSSKNGPEAENAEAAQLAEIVKKINAFPEAERDAVAYRLASTLADHLTKKKFDFDLRNGFHLDLLLEGVQAERVEISGNGYTNVKLNDASISGDLVVSAQILGQGDFTDAQIGRDFNLRALESGSSTFGSSKDFALILRGSQIMRRLSMPEKVVCGSTDLSYATCGILDDLQSYWPIADPNNRLHLNGFTYSRFEKPAGGDYLSGPSVSEMAEARVKWLLCQPDIHLRNGFNPQPWKEAAAAFSTDGYEQAAKLLTIRRRVAERHAASTPRIQKLINLLLHWVADYGFNPWKTVVFCLALIVIFAGMFAWADASCAADDLCSSKNGLFLKARFGDVDPAIVAEFYPRFNPLQFSLGTFIPLFELGSESFWRVNTRAELSLGGRAAGINVQLGALLYWIYVFERILGAVMIAIAITGFTGMLARDP